MPEDKSFIYKTETNETFVRGHSHMGHNTYHITYTILGFNGIIMLSYIPKIAALPKAQSSTKYMKL